MNTTFVAISNMSGITCASDSDHTIYQLSKQLPLAVAVNPHSPIPWDRVINAYKSHGDPESKKNFDDYIEEFFNLCPTLPFKAPNELSIEDGHIIFMGYGQDDLFPSITEIVVNLEDDNKIYIEVKMPPVTISHKNPVALRYLGKLNSVSSILYGATDETKSFLLEKFLEQFEIYKQRVIDKFKGTKYENFVAQKFAEYDPCYDFKDALEDTAGSYFEEIHDGLDSFSIEDMVTAAETIVDAEVRLDHLASASMGPLHNTREIAVITRTEGVTWIKHSLYAL